MAITLQDFVNPLVLVAQVGNSLPELNGFAVPRLVRAEVVLVGGSCGVKGSWLGYTGRPTLVVDVYLIKPNV